MEHSICYENWRRGWITMTVAKKTGLFLAALHLGFFLFVLINLVNSTDGMREILWAPFVVIDFPLSLLGAYTLNSWSGYSKFLDSFNNDMVADVLSPMSFLYGLGGTL